MKIGLYNLEPKINNIAMMKISSYHKFKGDQVEIYNHLFHKDYDLIYAFSLFDFTDKSMVSKGMITGGTGFDLTTKLPKQIEDSPLDYSIFPKCETSYFRFSIGCIRNCPFCVVRRKEGKLKPVWETSLNPNGKYITIMDNNFFANINWPKNIEYLKEINQFLDFQGVDVRILTKEMADALNSLKHYKKIKIAWDNPKEDLRPKLAEVIKWIKPYKLMSYVLIGFNSTHEENLYRVLTLWKEFKIDPFVMPFNKKDYYQHHFARYVNHKAIFKSHTWEEYEQKYMKTKRVLSLSLHRCKHRYNCI